MFIVPTKHYRGKFPLDAGGVVFNGPFPKEVADDYGQRMLEGNFPFVVKCDRDGNYLVDVPPVKVAVFVDLAPEPPKVSLPESTTGTTTADAVNAGVQGEEESQPVVEEVTEEDLKPAKKAGKKGK